ncbi:MAG: DUF1697 domain-containing protein [Segniliparus sp.]|uniref:DUF1697 domain-containing protein n=1 Tax=Segniliparus sp. TaxID=2804064 RepID=UPI003F31ECFB
MTRCAAFLRGVNVGGVSLRMAEVRQTVEDAGFAGVRTILASGNLLFDHEGALASAKQGVEEALRAGFGYEAWVLVYDLAEVARIEAAFPFEESDDIQSYVVFCCDPDVLDELSALRLEAPERLARGEGVLYWQTPKGTTLDGEMGKAMGKKRYKSSTTTRNLRTVRKVLSLA